MSIRVFLYSKRAEDASEQTQWPSAILLVDNDPDAGTLPITQTSNKAKHSLSSANNLSAEARVMDRPASCECEEGNKALGGQEVVRNILFIDLGVCAACWHMAAATFFFFIPQTQSKTEQNISHNQSFLYTHFLGSWLLNYYTFTITHMRAYTIAGVLFYQWFFSG